MSAPTRAQQEQTAVLELRLEVLDPGPRGRRWNGDPQASHEKLRLLLDVAQEARLGAEAAGLDVVRTSYGITGLPRHRTVSGSGYSRGGVV